LFFPTLALCGFTPKILKPDQYPELLNFDLGLTDLVKSHFGMDRDLLNEYYDINEFNKKISLFQPKFICFNGKESAKNYFNLKNTKKINYGLQKFSLGSTRFYVATSTSSQALAYWDIDTWMELKNLVQ
jgi:double-stranded uracil-DNA glycosylase